MIKNIVEEKNLLKRSNYCMVFKCIKCNKTLTLNKIEKPVPNPFTTYVTKATFKHRETVRKNPIYKSSRNKFAPF